MHLPHPDTSDDLNNHQEKLIKQHQADNFILWIDEQIRHLGWSDRQLALHAGISPSVISKARSGLRPIGWEACIAIANALNLPPDLVLQKAGHLPTTEQAEIGELSHIYQQLGSKDRKRILDIARVLYQNR